MTGAMYAAIAGLKTHMSKMNVIGNNIANVNTAGFKSQRTVFKDAMYTMYKSGSNGTDTVGGTNPAQIGYGSQISTIDLNMSYGSFAPGNTMDCMIDGDGFFLVGDKDVANVIDATNPSSFKSLGLTRVGDFGFGPDGYLVDGNGSCVYGFLSVGNEPNGNPIVSDQLVPIRLPKMEKVAVSLQTDIGEGVGSELEADELEDLTEGSDFEYVYKVRYPVVASAGDDAPATKADELLAEAAKTNGTRLVDYDAYMNGTLEDDEDPMQLAFAQLDSISIDQFTGRISGTTKDSDEWITIGFLALGNVTNPNGVAHTGGFYYTCGDGAGDLQISLMGGAAETLKVPGGGTLTHVNGSLAATDADGNPVDLSTKAEVSSAGITQLLTGGLEQSNVDLATEISEMITTQRGYQANTRIITVTDTMLEELVNMKR